MKQSRRKSVVVKIPLGDSIAGNFVSFLQTNISDSITIAVRYHTQFTYTFKRNVWNAITIPIMNVFRSFDEEMVNKFKN